MVATPDNNHSYAVFHMPVELDLYNAETMKQSVERLLAAEPRPVIFDCGETDYVDSSGIGVLVFIHGRFLKRQRRFCFTRFRANVSRVIALTGLDGVFPIEDDLEDAVHYMEKMTRL